MIGPQTSFDLVHVGKCGGGTVLQELTAKGYRFEHFHLRRPVVAADRRFVILVRDPVARFVSAYNWRRHLYEESLLAASPDDPVMRLRHDTEREFLSLFSDVNAFAEKLVAGGTWDVSPITTLMQLIGHVPQGFAWYLNELLDRIEPGQLLGVIATERFADDFESLFGFRPTASQHRNGAALPTSLSPAGRSNLVRQFAGEYRTLARLADLARRSGRPMSLEYLAA
jgi:hypothetical protein